MLLGIQARFREVGRIRTGERVTRGGKTYPSRLQTFRFTSTDRPTLDATAAKYGGTVEQWERGWQVTTEADRIAVMLPPEGTVEAYSLWYELWSGGGIQRRCNGTDAVIGGEDGQCQCDAEARECSPTLRVSFLLPDLPGLGIWRLETKGYNAAAELPGTLNLMRSWAAKGAPLRAILRLETRQVIRDGKKVIFTVPVLDPVGTINDMLTTSARVERPQLTSSGITDDIPDPTDDIERPVSPAAGEAPSGGANPPPNNAPAGDDLSHEGPPIGGVTPGDVGDQGSTSAGSSAASSRPLSADGVAGSLPVEAANEPAGAEVREDSAGSSPVSTPADEGVAGYPATPAEGAGGGTPALSSDQVQARYDWALRRGWSALELDKHAIVALGIRGASGIVEKPGPTVMEMSPDEWAIFARTIKEGPSTLPDPSDAAEYNDNEPELTDAMYPKPRTDEYRALSPADRKAARDYWGTREDA